MIVEKLFKLVENDYRMFLPDLIKAVLASYVIKKEEDNFPSSNNHYQFCRNKLD